MKKYIALFLVLILCIPTIGFGEAAENTFGDWAVDYFVDDFGDKTNETYIASIVTGTFSNTATNNSELTAITYFDGNMYDGSFAIRLLEYNNTRAVYYNTSNINLKVKIDDNIYSWDVSANNAPNGDLVFKPGLIYSDYHENAYYTMFYELANNKDLRCVITIDNSKYNFTISANGFINYLVFQNYTSALQTMENGDYKTAVAELASLGNYEDAPSKMQDCLKAIYEQAEAMYTKGKYSDAYDNFTWLAGYEYADAADKAAECMNDMITSGQIRNVITALRRQGKLKEAYALEYTTLKTGAIAAGYNHTVALKADGTVVATGNNDNGQCNVNGWKNIIAVAVGNQLTVGLKSDGTVVTTGFFLGDKLEVSKWTNIVAISTDGSHIVGLKDDGTVVAVSDPATGNIRRTGVQVNNWTNICEIVTGSDYTVGLKYDGTLIGTSDNNEYISEIYDWQDISYIQGNKRRVFGYKADGTFVFSRYTRDMQEKIGNWKNVSFIDLLTFGGYFGLNNNNTMMYSANPLREQDASIKKWKNIISVAYGSDHIIGLTSDGTVLSAGKNDDKQCNTSQWTNIGLPVSATVFTY